jgi:hypothetical protein
LAYQGEPAAYSEAAALQYGGPHAETLPCQSFEDVFDAVSLRKATHGVVPLENSIGGTIHRNYDLLLDHDLTISGEVELDVVHCLQALPGTKIGDIKVVYSHPQALAQCERYLKDLGASVEAVYDTAGGRNSSPRRKLAGAAALAVTPRRRGLRARGAAGSGAGLRVQHHAFRDHRRRTAGRRQQNHHRVRDLPSTPARAVQSAERVRAPGHQSDQARKPADAAGARAEYLFYVEVECAALRPRVRTRPDASRRIRPRWNAGARDL